MRRICRQPICFHHFVNPSGRQGARDPSELNNVYDDPAYSGVREELKEKLARLRKDVGDDGSHYPACEKIVQEFWDYDEGDREKAIEISHRFKALREASLESREGKAPPQKN